MEILFYDRSSPLFIRLPTTIFFLLGLFVIINACTKNSIPVADNEIPSQQVERIILDTSYGSDPNQKMDIYLPAGRTKATKVVIYIHGGGWESGSKNDAEYQQHILLLRQNWPEAAVATINYRLTSSPGIHYTEMMNDVTAAVNLMINGIPNFVVSDTLAMMGASAGGHLAMLYTYKYNSNEFVKCVASFFGPSKLSDWGWYNSILPNGQPVKNLLTQFNNSVWNQPLYEANSPILVATAKSKPTILFHGTLDAVVPLYQSQWMRGQLNTLGVTNEYYEYFDGHGFNNTNSVDAMKKAVNFFKKHLK